MGAIPSFIKVKDETVYYNGAGELLLFIPEVLFEKEIAVVEGEYIETLGVLNYAVVPKVGDKVKKVKTFYLPTRFVTKPGKIEKVKDFAISPNYTADFRICHYENNGSDEIIHETRVPKDMLAVDQLFSLMVTTGNTPKTINYYDLYKYHLDSIDMAGNKYGMAGSLFGLLVSELCRDPDDINKPFRLGKNIDKNPYSYIPISIKEVPKLTTTFMSLTSENFDDAVVGAIMNDSDKTSPLERVLMG